MDEQLIQDGQRWLEALMQVAGLPSQVEVDTSKLETEGSCWLTIDDQTLSPEQIQVFIGHNGTALDAIQYLANTTLNMGKSDDLQMAFTIELAGYRVQRQAELKAMADQAAQQVRETGDEYEMVALSAAERRQVHTYLKTYEDLDTYSRGKEPDRRLVVRLAASE